MALETQGVRLVAQNLGGFLSAMRQYNTAIKSAESATQRFAERARRTGTALAALAAPIVGLGAVSLRTFGNFEQSMARVGAVAGATTQELEQLTAVAREMGETTQFSANQAAGGLIFLSQAGLDVETQIAALPEVLQLAAAAQLDMASAANIVTNVMAGFGLEVNELTRANDTLVTAFTSANTDLTQLAQALKFVGPVASAAGLSFEETAASLALMGNQGIQATMAGTALRGSIARLLNPSNEARRIIQRLGLQTTDAAGQMLPLVNIIEQLETVGLTAADAMAIFGLRAGPAMLALVREGSGALRELTEEMDMAGGVTQEIQEKQLDTFLGSMNLLSSAAKGLAINIGGALSPAIRSLTENIKPVLTAVGNWLAANPKLTVTLFALATIVGVVGAGLVLLALIAPGVVTLFGLAGGAVSFLTIQFVALNISLGPILLIILAITAAIAIGILIWKNWGTIVSFVKDRVNDLIAVVNTLIRFLTLANPLLAALSVFGVRIPEIPQFADGGTQRQSGLALVGERGPELVNLPGGSTVTPTSRTTNFNVNASYTSPQTPNNIRLDLEAIAMMTRSDTAPRPTIGAARAARAVPVRRARSANL